MEPTRGLSGSPPAIAPSKRDKRRSIIADKLNGLTATFSEHRDQHYRSQVQAIQIDMSLILNAMPYSDAPLPDSPEEIAELVNATTGGSMPAGFDVNNGEAGKRYAKFADETNDALEERDSALVMLLVRDFTPFLYSRSFLSLVNS